MNQENLDSRMPDKLALLGAGHPGVYHTYQLMEQLRPILHMKNPDLAALELDQWIERVKKLRDFGIH